MTFSLPRTALRVARSQPHRPLSASRVNSIVRSQVIYQIGTRRLASSEATSKRSGTWRGTLFRWGLAGGIVYYYNTSPLFANEPALLPTGPPPVEPLPTLDSIAAARSKKKITPTVSSVDTISASTEVAGDVASTPVGVADLEAEADGEGAFNPVTGEINWDCPCLGGMAHGPCGEEFKAAFSCFVYSKEEPKGMECIDKFKGMQDCFRAHPDVYAEELAEDDEEAELGSGQNPLPDGKPGDQPQDAKFNAKESANVSKLEETNVERPFEKA